MENENVVNGLPLEPLNVVGIPPNYIPDPFNMLSMILHHGNVICPRWQKAWPLISSYDYTFGDDVINTGTFGVVVPLQKDGANLAGKVVMLSKYSYHTVTARNDAMRLWSKLNHPNVIQLMKIVSKGIEMEITIMELAKTNLQHIVLYYGIKLLHIDLLIFAQQIASGMQYLHQNRVAHLYLSLDHILFLEPNRYKICGMGSLRRISREQMSKRKMQMITSMYDSPQMELPGMISPQKSDIWSYGVVLFLCNTGRDPFPEHTNIELRHAAIKLWVVDNTDLSTEFESIIRQILSYVEHDRPNWHRLLQSLAMLESHPLIRAAALARVNLFW